MPLHLDQQLSTPGDFVSGTSDFALLSHSCIVLFHLFLFLWSPDCVRYYGVYNSELYNSVLFIFSCLLSLLRLPLHLHLSPYPCPPERNHSQIALIQYCPKPIFRTGDQQLESPISLEMLKQVITQLNTDGFHAAYYKISIPFPSLFYMLSIPCLPQNPCFTDCWKRILQSFQKKEKMLGRWPTTGQSHC